MDKTRPVFLLLHGQSLENIESLMPKMKSKENALWMTLNNFEILEKKLELHFDRVWITSYNYVKLEGNPGEKEVNIVKYVSEGGVLVTNNNFINQCNPELQKLLQNPPEENVIKTDIGYCPEKWVNSLTAMLWYLSKEGYTSIFLFGCDGGMLEGQNKVYYAEEMHTHVHEQRSLVHAKDTEKMNSSFWNWYEEYKVKVPKIFNVTDGSLVTCFDIISWEDFSALLDATPEKSF